MSWKEGSGKGLLLPILASRRGPQVGVCWESGACSKAEGVRARLGCRAGVGLPSPAAYSQREKTGRLAPLRHHNESSV